VSRHLQTRVSDTIWRALAERSRTSGLSISHLVQAALAESLDVDHHSIFQVSTSGAIVRGLYRGCVSVADLRRHGDVGIGTFEDLDGELVMLDGDCYQARSDGTVSVARDDALTPFATVVSFVADTTAELTGIGSYDDLTASLDDLRDSANAIVAFRLRGTFATLTVRAACRAEPGEDLVHATAHQSEFELTHAPATVVGFWSPEYAKAISIAGYHLHAVTDDRRHGGHVLGVSATELVVEVHRVNDVHLAIPETEEFLAADLAGDRDAELAAAEHQSHGSPPQ
jgi:acetolactate decarboxylase